MKNPILLLILLTLISATQTVAQKKKKKEQEAEIAEQLDKVFNTKVLMDVDSTIFDSRQGNMYISEGSKAFIMTMVAPQSIEKAEEKFDNAEESEKYEVVEKKKIEHEGRTILYQKALAEKDGQKAIIYVYQVEANAESTILISATQLDAENEKVFKAIQRAAYTAKLADETK